jgi:Tfp pilus assembly PilM family ATPase
MHASKTKGYHATSHFFDLFPTPRFLEMSAPGLSIEDRTLHYIEFNRFKGGLVLKNHASANIPEGIIQKGEIVDSAGFTAILKAFARTHNLRHVRCSIPEEQSYIFRGKIPKTTESSEIRTAVEFIIEENVPLMVSESVFDYSVIEQENQNEATSMDVSVSVVSERVVRSYLEALRKADLSPLHFEIESQAIAKALVRRDDPTAYLLLNFFETKIGIYIVSENVVQFSSTIALSGDRKVVPFDELKNEIHKVLSYWDSQLEKLNEKKKVISNVIVSGVVSDEKELFEKLDFLKMSLEIGNVWSNAFSFNFHIPEIPKAESLSYATAIGLALPHHVHF